MSALKNTSLILIGMPGVGKSSLGKKIANALDLEFSDTDLLIEESIGCSLQAFINREGEASFLKLEEKIVRQLDKNFKVLAPGGSLIYNKKLMRELKPTCFFLYLNDDLAAIQNRIPNIKDRGIIGLDDKSFSELYEERRVLYEEYADYVLDYRDKTWTDCLEEALSILRPIFT